jgi:hypothetical protein
MARITVNETGTQPLVLLSTDIANGNVQTGNIVGANVLSVGCLQDVTITSSTGVFSWTDFCSVDTNKLPTPADNEIATNVVIDSVKYFGNANAASGTAAFEGMSSLSQNKVAVQFLVVWNNSDVANVVDGNIASGTYWSSGVGYVTSLAPTVSPDAPVWVTPMTIAVDGTMYSGNG